jgi:predicted nuclease with RNAse H fold
VHLSIGVDVSEKRGLDVVVLDAQRRLVEPPRAGLPPDGLESLIESLKPDAAVVAIDSPPGPGISGPSRECELALRRRGVNIFSTPSDPIHFEERFYNWIRVGRAAFEAASAAGFEPFDLGRDIQGTAIEVYPHASDVFLRDCLPPSGVTRQKNRKKQWRSETLRRAGVTEIGQLSSVDAVDAALAALTGLDALEDDFEALGESPFFIIVPAGHTEAFSR